MQNLYYVIEKEVDGNLNEGWESCTGNKQIRVYNINTQSMQLVMFCEIESFNFKNSENEIQAYLDNNDYESDTFNLIEL